MLEIPRKNTGIDKIVSGWENVNQTQNVPANHANTGRIGSSLGKCNNETI